MHVAAAATAPRSWRTLSAERAARLRALALAPLGAGAERLLAAAARSAPELAAWVEESAGLGPGSAARSRAVRRAPALVALVVLAAP
jgi:hypothetical protein